MSEFKKLMENKIFRIWFLFVMIVVILLSFEHLYVMEQEQSIKPLWNKHGDGIDDMTPDGSLVVIAGGTLYLLKSDGEILWKMENIGSEFACISDDGEFIVSTLRDKEKGTFHGNIVAFNKDGEKLWSYKTGLIRALSMTSKGDLIAVTAFDKASNGYYTFTYHIYLFDKEGNKLWDKVMDQHFESISISENGYIITGSREKMVYLFDKEGKILWSKDIDLDVRSVAITEDGNYIFFSSMEVVRGKIPKESYYAPHFNAYNINGERLWGHEINWTAFSISLSSNGEHIAVSEYSKFYLFKIDGELLWSYKGDNGTFNVAIDKNGRYVVANVWEARIPFFSSFDYIYVFDKEGKILWKFRSKGTIVSLAISDDGRYVTFGHRGNEMFFFDNFKAIEEYKEGLEAERKIGISYELIVTFIAGILLSWRIIRRGTK